MQATQVIDYAQRLYKAHGDRAEYEAACRADECQQRGDAKEADVWKQVRLAIRELRP
jgi:hypothetical protein